MYTRLLPNFLRESINPLQLFPWILQTQEKFPQKKNEGDKDKDEEQQHDISEEELRNRFAQFVDSTEQQIAIV